MTRGVSGVDARFAALGDLVRTLAERGIVRSYRKGTVLIEEGDRGDTLYIVLSGRVRVYSSNEAGREVSYGTYGAGEYLGEMSLDGGTRSASVITLEATQCSVVTRATLEAYIAEQPAFAFELLAKLIRRVRAATLSTKQLALNDVYGRLKALLESHADADAPLPRTLNERLTHQDMSSRIGCSREMVSRLMKDLQRGAYIDHDGSVIRLLRPLPPRW
jgi:CRP/FNR family transcriptional regulator, cyclic AMP receptor protein